MPKKSVLFILLLLSLWTSACGSNTPTAPQTSATTVFTSTPDPCSAQNIPVEIEKVQKTMREFDDYATLASNTPQDQVIQILPDMQEIARRAEELPVPACLENLKKLQTSYMQEVVAMLMIFMTAADQARIDQISAGIAHARDTHLQYDVERARLLGVTLMPTPTLAEENLDSIFKITNISTGIINLYTDPDLNAPNAGMLRPQASLPAYGRTVDGRWLQVQAPDNPEQRVWVYASLVQISIPFDLIPVVAR